MMPYVASGLVALSRLLKERRFRAALATGGAILLLTFALNLRESGLRQQARSRAIQLLVFRGDRADTEDEARLAYESAIRTAAYPGEAEAAYLALARIAAARGEIAEATRYEAIAAGWLPDDLLLDLTARPDDPDALFALGRHRLLTRDPGGAAEAFAGAAHLAPGDPDILYASAVAAFGSGSATPDQVAGMIGKAMSIGLRFSPNAVPASVLEARCHIAMGKLDEAEAALDRALRRSPDDGPALALRARIRSNG